MRYPIPNPIPHLPQGDFAYLPKVEVFPDYINPALLQADINIFLAAVVLIPDERYIIHDVHYSVSPCIAPTPAPNNWTEFEADAEFGNAALVDWISLANKTISYYIAGTSHDIVYADQAAALAVYDSWKAAHPPPSPPEPCQLLHSAIVHYTRIANI